MLSRRAHGPQARFRPMTPEELAHRRHNLAMPSPCSVIDSIVALLDNQAQEEPRSENPSVLRFQ